MNDKYVFSTHAELMPAHTLKPHKHAPEYIYKFSLDLCLILHECTKCKWEPTHNGETFFYGNVVHIVSNS